MAAPARLAGLACRWPGDDTRLFNERFNSATIQLGHERAAVRAAAVYAVTGLADDARVVPVEQAGGGDEPDGCAGACRHEPVPTGTPAT